MYGEENLTLIFYAFFSSFSVNEWFCAGKAKRSQSLGSCSAESHIRGTPMHIANYTVEPLREGATGSQAKVKSA